MACAIVALSAATGCRSPIPDQLHAPDGSRAFGERCDESSITQQPDLMGLSMDFRANVAVARQQGVLAVRYAGKGCHVTLEVLPNCLATGSYTFSPYPGNESKTASDKQELFAKLPLGAVQLEGKLQQGRSLRTDYRFAGMLTLPVDKSFNHADLHGQDCDRATHIVNRIYMGGFALAVGESSAIAAAATVFGAGFGGGTTADGEVIASEGIPEACVEAQKNGQFTAQCGAPLRLGLLAIADPDPDAYKPDDQGFVPLLVVDKHHCRANEEVWNGSSCESLNHKKSIYDDLLFRDEHGCIVGRETFLGGKCMHPEGHEKLDALRLEK